MELKIYRTQAKAKLPTRAHDGDAGMDLYYCPDKKQVDQVPIHPEKHFFLGQE